MDLFLGTILIWPISWIPAGFNACDGTLLNIQQNMALYTLMGVTFGGDDVNTFAVPDLRGRVPVGAGLAKTGTAYSFGQVGGVESFNAVVELPGNTYLGTGGGFATGSFSIAPSQMPTHSHGLDSFTVPVSIPANTAGGTTDTPGSTTILAKGTVVGGPVNTTAKSYTVAAANAYMAPINVTVPASNTQAQGLGTPIQFMLVVNTTVKTAVSSLPMATEVEVMQPFMVLNYMICTSGLYPPRP
jgi:microcystin-dependent protein